MLRLLTASAFAAATLAVVAVPFTAAAQSRAKSEILDMDEKDRATVAKESLRQKREQRQSARDGRKSGSNDDCGSVEIGNDNGKNSGSSRIAERQKTVIVTGNIINTANCK